MIRYLICCNEHIKIKSRLDQLSVNSEYLNLICDQLVTELREHAATVHPDDPNRFSKLLLRLSPLRSLQSDVIEEIFFTGLIGNIQIDTIIPYILQMDMDEYNTSGILNVNSNTDLF